MWNKYFQCVIDWFVVVLFSSMYGGCVVWCFHYCDVIMGTVASQITSITIVYSIVYSAVDQRKHQSFASLAFVRGIRRGPVNSPHKWPVARKMFPFDDVITLCAVPTNVTRSTTDTAHCEC